MTRFYHKTSQAKDNVAERIFSFPRLYRFKVNLLTTIANWLSLLWFRNYFDPIDVLAGQVNDKKVIELGCGHGHLYSRLKDNTQRMHFVGSDINEHMIDHCRSRYSESEWLCLKSLPYPFNNGDFDVVLIWNVMHHLNEYNDILTFLSEALRIGQSVIFLEPAQSNPVFLKLLKALYWKITDGGKFYFTYSDWQIVFRKINATVAWEKISEPLNQIYMAEIRKSHT